MNEIADRYLSFAKLEAAQRSPLYETFAKHVARTPGILAFLDRLPHARQQPNLLFAALRFVAGTPATTKDFDMALQKHSDAVARVMMSRTTQTNEPGRCAALLPVLANIEGPLALIEVGASAGLCLLMDEYGYEWSGGKLAAPLGKDAPIFPCKTTENTPIPVRHPEIVWRAGLDLNPLDVSNDDNVAWLENLVWPEHQERLLRLKKAVEIACRKPPRIVSGNLLTDLPALIAEAPRDLTVVVFHTAVLSYVASQTDRDDFARRMINSRIVWISNEAPEVFPQIAHAVNSVRNDMFLLSVNGEPVAWTAPHGQQLDWL